MRNISLVLSYEGTRYHGWQCQPNVVTVEETVRKAVERILDHPSKLYAGARTDSGVHALGQVTNFFTPKPIELKNLVRGLNSLLPPDIRARDAREAEDAFHARYWATSKIYIYSILNDPCNSPFLCRYSLHVPYTLDLAAMKRTIRLVKGEHDFSAFKKKDEFYRNPVREVRSASVARRGKMVYIAIEASGFLRYMVRNIVGTLVLVGQGRMGEDEFKSVLESRERERAGPTAPAHGLILKAIRYAG